MVCPASLTLAILPIIIAIIRPRVAGHAALGRSVAGQA
jgi:hypothetical protein